MHFMSCRLLQKTPSDTLREREEKKKEMDRHIQGRKERKKRKTRIFFIAKRKRQNQALNDIKRKKETIGKRRKGKRLRIESDKQIRKRLLIVNGISKESVNTQRGCQRESG